MQNISEEYKIALTAVFALLLWSTALSFFPPWDPNDQPMFDVWFYYIAQNPEGGALAYPIGALAYFDLIRAFSADAAVFSHVFKLLSFIWLGAMLFVYGKICGNKEIVKISIIFPFMIFVLNGTVEIFAVSVALIGAYLFITGRRMAGWALVVFAAFVKVFPIFVLPLFFIIEMKKWREGAPRIALAGLLGLALLACSGATLGSIAYQAERGLQFQDIYANALMIVSISHGMGMYTEYVTGSVDLVVPPSLGFLIPLSTILQIGSVLAVTGLFFLEKNNEKRFWEYAFLALAAAVFFGKISSTQFMFWPIAFAIPLTARKEYRLLYPACLALSFLSLLIFPYFWSLLEDLDPWAVLILTARNLVVGFMIAYVALGVLRKDGAEEAEYVRKADF